MVALHRMTWVSIVHLQCNDNERVTEEMCAKPPRVLRYNLRFENAHKWNCLSLRAPFRLLRRENILVLDIFFEALNYEKIEQKKAYEIAGLLGKSPH